jgi:hypothetical protein
MKTEEELQEYAERFYNLKKQVNENRKRTTRICRKILF